MIRLSPFDMQAPATPRDAAVILSRANGDAKILAGGTDLVVAMKQGTERPGTVVWLGKIPELVRISFSEDHGVSVGAMCTLSEVESNAEIQKYYPSLVRAIRSIATPQIRNRATIGGNLCLNTRCFYYDQSEFWRSSLGYCLKHGNGLCHAAPELNRCTAVFCSDLAPLLIALGATIRITGPAAQETRPLARLYHNDGAHHLAISPSDVLTSVTIPYDPSIRSAHGKMRSRLSVDFAIANVGIALSVRDNRCEVVRIVVGAVSSAPIDASDTARELVGRECTDERIREVAESISSRVRPMPNVEGAVRYRKRMVGVLVKRTMQEALGVSSDRGRRPEQT